MTALRQEVSQANRQGMEVSQKVDVLAASVQSVAGVAQEAQATAPSLATMSGSRACCPRGHASVRVRTTRTSNCDLSAFC